MTDRRAFLQTLAATSALPLATIAEPQSSGGDDRRYWLSVLRRIAHPVLSHLANRQLKAKMPIEARPNVNDRPKYSHLEAIGRLLTGFAPWLELEPTAGEEGKLRSEFAELARRSITAATDPASPDFLNFSDGQQPLVDSAFLAHAMLRAPNELWKKLDATTQKNLVAALKTSRRIKPGFNNWLLFAAMIEAFLCFVGEEWDAMRVDYAIRQHEQWYKGDGLYGDGPDFHWDYYNSYVIQPMLLDVLHTVSQKSNAWDNFKAPMLKRAQRYAAIQERLISPEGTFPAIGRSLAYRFGAFQLLGQMALRHQLPDGVSPAQVRCALTAVIRRMIESPGTFDSNGWLTIGFCGHQPDIGESYISTGSLYLCAAGLLPLGLPSEDEFWNAAPQDWTARKAWSGINLPADHAA
ncbi:MAG TPA: DUF2264 domain-containing protein [Blastocatellia bacterium]|nr:DUF2264 domain-containing protein [Blastocatellia bacterium]